MNDAVRSTIQKRDARGVIRHGAEWLTLWSDPDSMKSGAELKREAAEQGTAQRLEQRLAATARAVSANPDMQMSFESFGPDAIETLSTAEATDAEALSALRGEIDSYALLRRYHDASLHGGMAPLDAASRKLFDMCEEVRCEALGARQFPGVRQNIVASHHRYLLRSHLLNAHIASLIPPAEGLRMVVRDSLLGESDPSIESSGFWMWDRWLRTRFASDLAALTASMGDQVSYAALARSLIEKLVAELGSTRDGGSRLQPSTNAQGEEKDGEDIAEPPEGENAIFEPGNSLLDGGTRGLALLHDHAEITRTPAYSAFTTRHDLVLHASELADSATLRKERATLEQRRAEFRRDLARLVTRLQRNLLAWQTRNWSFDLDDGLIDASRLDRVVVDPGFASAYKQEEESEFRDTVVSILIDNSGSMRGKPIEIACVAADMISTALERCGVSCEILGFTTKTWKGGESAKDWTRAGRPENPGRLNDTLHIIYKSADEPVRRTRLALCAMLDSALLKENIDGEALLWASRRLLVRRESRKVLIVISDGAPVDQATLEENKDKALLDRHLREIIAQIESSSSIELAAIGIKHDVRKYYANSAQIDNVEALGEALVRMIDKLMTR